MILCLSSSTRILYHQDALRTIGLPRGGSVQFRYDNNWVSPQVRNLAESDRLTGEQVLIAYADQSKLEGELPTGRISLIPLRLGKVTSYAASGETLTLELRLNSLAYAEDLEAWTAEVTNLTEGALPSWVDGSVRGLLCAVLNASPSHSVESNDIGDWQKIVSQLATCEDFISEETFLLVAGLARENEFVNKGAKIELSTWPHSLGADNHRSLLVYHYHPTKAPENLSIRAFIGPELRFEDPDRVFLESRYDLKRIRIRSGDPTVGTQASWLQLVTSHGNDAEAHPLRLDLPLEVKGSLLKRLLTIGAVGAGLAGAQIAPLFTRDDVMAHERRDAIIAIVIFSLLASVFGVLGSRRSL